MLQSVAKLFKCLIGKHINPVLRYAALIFCLRGEVALNKKVYSLRHMDSIRSLVFPMQLDSSHVIIAL